MINQDLKPIKIRNLRILKKLNQYLFQTTTYHE